MNVLVAYVVGYLESKVDLNKIRYAQYEAEIREEYPDYYKEHFEDDKTN